MRLYLLPVSTRRTLLYAQRLNVTTTSSERSSYVDKGASWAAKKWSEWEKMERGWQRKVVGYGNQAFRRIPFEEWGLKSVPPLSARRKAEELTGKEKVELVFPALAIPEHKAEAVVRMLATERQALHRKRLLWCFVGMPITAPFALVPVIPNLPFFYLVYRAWSHWRALSGGRHVQWLLQNKLLALSPSKELDQLYTKNGGIPAEEEEGKGKEGASGKELMLISKKQTAEFSTTLDLPSVEIELERAIWQVERTLEGEKEDKKG
ncbi:putative C23H3.12c-like protein [Cladobotryum mycophilum]|uniref:C23H3.12c-like protein n=1 Tax=Cladobotryum mycophilum TaxID=491253 RepID=A0ABR0T2F5_9HYPO